MKYLVNKEEQKQIQEAIVEFEKKSSAEIVTVIAKQSDAYLFIPLLWVAICSLIVPWVLSGIFEGMSQKDVNLTQLIVFIVLAGIVQIKSIKILLVPSFVKKKRSSNMAKTKFFEILKEDTQKDGFVMLFVSEAEKYVEILTDNTVANKVDNALWSETIENFIVHVKAGHIAQGYLETIQKASELLIELFPETKEDKDNLPNHLILL